MLDGARLSKTELREYDPATCTSYYLTLSLSTRSFVALYRKIKSFVRGKKIRKISCEKRRLNLNLVFFYAHHNNNNAFTLYVYV